MNVLFILHAGTNSRSIFVDIIKGFAAAGHSVVTWDASAVSDLLAQNPSRDIDIRTQVSDQIAKLVRDANIDMTVAMWSIGLGLTICRQEGDRIVTLFERIACPHLLMWLDAPDRAQQESVRPVFKSGFLAQPYLFHFINNHQTAAEMREVYHFDHVLPRQYGINPDVFKPYPDEPKEYDIVFNSNYGNWDDAPAWAADELKKDDPDMFALRSAVAKSQRPAREKIVDRYPAALKKSADEMIERLTEMQLYDRTQPLLDRARSLAAANPAAQLTLEEPELYAAVATQVRRLEIYERAFVFVHLSHYFKCGLFGVIDYASLGCTVKSLGSVKFEDQARIYNRAKMGLSVMRWEDESGFHIKPYEITASGIACLAQHRPQTEHLFTDDEIIRFRTLPEARTKVRTLLANPARLAQIAAAGRARTLKDHTWSAWANHMTTHIAQWKSAQPARAAA